MQIIQRLKGLLDFEPSALRSYDVEHAGTPAPAEADPFYVKVPVDALVSGLSRTALALYVELACLAEEAQEEGTEFVEITKEDLARFSGMEHGKSAYPYLNELLAFGWLKRWEKGKGFVRVWVRLHVADAPY